MCAHFSCAFFFLLSAHISFCFSFFSVLLLRLASFFSFFLINIHIISQTRWIPHLLDKLCNEYWLKTRKRRKTTCVCACSEDAAIRVRLIFVHSVFWAMENCEQRRTFFIIFCFYSFVQFVSFIGLVLRSFTQHRCVSFSHNPNKFFSLFVSLFFCFIFRRFHFPCASVCVMLWPLSHDTSTQRQASECIEWCAAAMHWLDSFLEYALVFSCGGLPCTDVWT